jgi:murein DD-endopeptidase MepM/ murein hydrolase activator NlpD
MEGGSFDPRQWQLQGKPVTPANGTTTPEAIPEFWQAAARGSDAPPTTPLGKPDGSGFSRRLLPYAASLAILALATLAAGVQREAPLAGAQLATETAAASPEATPLPKDANSVERALSLADAAGLASSLIAAGVPAAEANAATAAAAGVLDKPGEIHAVMSLSQDGTGTHLRRLQASYADGSGATVDRQADGTYTVSRVAADLTRKIQVIRGELDSESFYSSAVHAGLIDTLVPEFINAFAFDFNLASEVQPGDTFEVAFEQSVNGRGEAVGAPQLLYASLTTRAKSKALYRYQAAGGEAAWYDGNGGSIKRGFMRTPIDGARISSKYGMRFHPVLHYTRLHAGVDFAAPIGTPIYAAADGTISTASPNRCGGNWVIIDHQNAMQTRYFHLSRYAEGLHAGQHVTQGETVGYVGTTGTCTTGPHLHYETLVKGEHMDPLSIPVESGTVKRLEGSAIAGFMRERDRIDIARAQQAY